MRQNTVVIEAGDANGHGPGVRRPDNRRIPRGRSATGRGVRGQRRHRARFPALKPVPPNSFQGTADVAQIMQTLATSAGLGFENNGVDVKLSNLYLHGTLMQQMELVGKAADIGWFIDPASNTLGDLAQERRARRLDPGDLAADRLIGYPAFSRNVIEIRTLFNPAVKLGGQIQIPSSEQLISARGLVERDRIDYALSARRCPMALGDGGRRRQRRAIKR